MTLSASLLCAVATALSPQGLRLPPNPKPTAQAVQRPLNEVERFRRDLQNLHGAPAIAENALQKMAQDYPDVPALVIERLRSALQRELMDLTVVARRFGKPRADRAGVQDTRVADELLFQLLARPLGDATREVMETMVALKGDDAKRALQECLRGRISGVRRIAVEVYAPLATADDLDFALLLAGDALLDVQVAGVQLLAAVPSPRARERLCELLSQKPALAGAACRALIQVGADAVPPLTKIVSGPAIDRSVPYAAFALVLIDDGQGKLLPPASVVPALVANLRGADTLARALAAVALAELSYRGASSAATDAEIVSALIDVAEPLQFVANLELVRHPAEARLRLLTGRLAGREQMPWRDWWKDGSAGFLGMRAHLAADDKSVGSALLMLRDETRMVRLIGEDIADLPTRAGTLDFVLGKEQMQKVLADLDAAGFAAAAAAPAVTGGLPLVRSLQLQIGGGRTQLAAPAGAAPAFDQFVAIVTQACDSELWQQLRSPVDEPDRASFWRGERRWLAEHPQQLERDHHFVQRVIATWPALAAPQRRLALSRLLSMPDRKELLSEADGEALLGLVRGAAHFGEEEQSLLELAASTPGERAWRDAIDVAVHVGNGRTAVEKVFAVLGADRVLAALGDERPAVRRAAIDEVVRSRDMRAEQPLLKMLDDGEPSVRQAAIFAAGQLELQSARQPLIDRIKADDTPPPIRREALRALGKVGGEDVFRNLQRALGAPVAEDRDAALRGLGELKDPRAAALLAQIFAAGPTLPNGELARFYLERMGQKVAVPALRALLPTASPGPVRNQVVLLLGSYQDPSVIPDLVAMLRADHDTLAASTLLSCTIGLDVAGAPDRLAAMDRWLPSHKNQPQWQWLIDACRVADFRTSLEAAWFAPGAGLQPVPELARIMVDGDPGRLRVLAAAVLRSVTGEDYGRVTTGTPHEMLDAMAGRYRVLYEGARAAVNR